MLKIVFLVSGGGGNLKFLYNAIHHKLINPAELYVIADRECGALEFAKSKNIQCNLITYSRKTPKDLQNILNSYNPDIIITNWHKIIDADTVNQFSGKMINLHYSLLPAFPGHIGTDTIAEAINSGCKYVGTTCHYVNEEVDAGQIITQSIIKADASLETIIPKVFRSGCLCLLNGISITSKTPIHSHSVTSEIIDFSPSLTFSEKIFTENFWEEVSTL